MNTIIWLILGAVACLIVGAAGVMQHDTLITVAAVVVLCVHVRRWLIKHHA